MSSGLPILLYHSVQDHAPGSFGPWAVGRKLFEDHMDMLVEHGYTALSIEQLMKAKHEASLLGEKTVLVTFDDGFADFSSNAWPVMKARGIPTTLYVTAGVLDGRSSWLEPQGAGQQPMLSAADVRELADEGVQIGAHSMTHPQLDCIDRELARDEIIQSKVTLEQIVGRSIDSFAYPHGYHDRAVKKMVVEAGFTSAVAVRNALSHAHDDEFALARYTVMGDCSVAKLEDVLAGRGIGIAEPSERWRTSAWRQVRRFRARRAG